MKNSKAMLLLCLLLLGFGSLNETNKNNDLKIARTIRLAVRDADSTLLNASSLTPWREYLKICALKLDGQLQPLVLIKFDEDVGFREQLKTIIKWEAQWQKKESEHYIYYFRWDQPPPDFIAEIQETHFNELASLFQIEPEEKIPYRYDPNAGESTVFPFDDLRGGIVSPHPFDLQAGALAALYLINSEPPSLLQPLARIYGNYFQNPSTAKAYFDMCLQRIEKLGYVSAATLFQKPEFAESQTSEWYSAYAFVYQINQQFGPLKIAEFLSKVNCKMEEAQFQSEFEETFGIGLSEFETDLLKPKSTATKM